MGLEDVPAARLIEAAAYGEESPDTDFEGQLGNGFTHYLVARRGGRVVGFAGMWLMVGQAHIATVAVDPGEQRTGVATALLRRCAEVSRAAELPSIALEVRASNGGAQRFYEALGFTTVGTLRRYYREPDEDAVVMLCEALDELAAGRGAGG